MIYFGSMEAYSQTVSIRAFRSTIPPGMEWSGWVRRVATALLIAVTLTLLSPLVDPSSYHHVVDMISAACAPIDTSLTSSDSNQGSSDLASPAKPDPAQQSHVLSHTHYPPAILLALIAALLLLIALPLQPTRYLSPPQASRAPITPPPQRAHR